VFAEVADVSEGVSTVLSLTSTTDYSSDLVNLLNLDLMLINLVCVDNLVNRFKEMLDFGLFCRR
jgi:hypothetical protein